MRISISGLNGERNKKGDVNWRLLSIQKVPIDGFRGVESTNECLLRSDESQNKLLLPTPTFGRGIQKAVKG